MNRNTLQVGDTVVISPPNQYELYQILTVERVTKTQVTAGGARYMKSTGRQVGGAYDTWSRYHCPVITDKTSDEAENLNKQTTATLHKNRLASRLHSHSRGDWLKMPVGMLERMIAVVDEFEVTE